MTLHLTLVNTLIARYVRVKDNEIFGNDEGKIMASDATEREEKTVTGAATMEKLRREERERGRYGRAEGERGVM